MNRRMSKIALGTANFGLKYGLANNIGRVPKSELEKILSVAETAGVRFIDTAQSYGDSENRIGSLCNKNFSIVTKMGPNLETGYANNSMRSLVEQSCKRLERSQLYAVMLHRPEVLFSSISKQIVRELNEMKDQNIISKIGVSIYSPEILTAISKIVKLDIVQVPFNIFDQQILSSGWSDKLKWDGVEIHARSVFLQGLLLMQQSSLPCYFTKYWRAHFDSWYKFLNDNSVDALEVAFKFALHQDWIDRIVVGVDSVSHLQTLLEIEESSEAIDFPLLGCTDANLINPSKWDLA
jgi:aryl-alcohol dehydrogenase-like predicted oxidoreductase